jgi:hypothetical protein
VASAQAEAGSAQHRWYVTSIFYQTAAEALSSLTGDDGHSSGQFSTAIPLTAKTDREEIVGRKLLS